MLPLDDRFRERVADPTRPLVSQQQDVYRYFPGTSPVPNQRVPAAPMGYSNSIEGLQVGRCWSTPIAYAHFRDSFPFTGRLLVVELRSDPASQLRRTNYADPGDERSAPGAAKKE